MFFFAANASNFFGGGKCAYKRIVHREIIFCSIREYKKIKQLCGFFLPLMHDPRLGSRVNAPAAPASVPTYARAGASARVHKVRAAAGLRPSAWQPTAGDGECDALKHVPVGDAAEVPKELIVLSAVAPIASSQWQSISCTADGGSICVVLKLPTTTRQHTSRDTTVIRAPRLYLWGPQVGLVAKSPLPSGGSQTLESGGQYQKWPASGQSGNVNPAV